ncbi:hypothetical protein EJB05_43975, partial [Eragrostis curvula]
MVLECGGPSCVGVPLCGGASGVAWTRQSPISPCRASSYLFLVEIIPESYLLGYSLAPYVIYSLEAGYTGFDCGTFATIGSNGQGYLLPGTWVETAEHSSSIYLRNRSLTFAPTKSRTQDPWHEAG